MVFGAGLARRRLASAKRYPYLGLDDEVDGQLTVVPAYPDLGECLRLRGCTGKYRAILIHMDDVQTFVYRRRAHRGLATAMRPH